MSDKKYYLTEDGLKKINYQHEELKKQRKEKLKIEAPEVVYSEDVDPEYLTFRKDLNILEEKILKLEEVLRNAEIIKPPSKGCKEIRLGAEIVLDAKEKEDKVILVGTMEADPVLGKISDESPVGRALLGKKEGEEVIISSSVQKVYKIKKVSYPSL